MTTTQTHKTRVEEEELAPLPQQDEEAKEVVEDSEAMLDEIDKVLEEAIVEESTFVPEYEGQVEGPTPHWTRKRRYVREHGRIVRHLGIPQTEWVYYYFENDVALLGFLSKYIGCGG